MTTKMWKVAGEKLQPLDPTRLDKERRLEEWIEADPSILGLDVLLIGRQIRTAFGGFIDLLGINQQGDLAILELKRDRTPREIVAQVLDYASWICGLSTRQVHDIADAYFAEHELAKRLPEAFKEHFGTTVPENLNNSHSMVVIASELDDSSKRIVEYLATQHGLEINTAFFNCFWDGAGEYLVADWLMDQDEVRERSESKTRAPWTGVWYVNFGEGPHRCWDDARKYGFVAAGSGPLYSEPLKRLGVGDWLYAYHKGHGYIGYGVVTSTAVRAKDFSVNGKPLLDLPLKLPNIGHDKDDDERAEYLVGVQWTQTVSLDEAKRFEGAFANQNVVCKLRDEATLHFLKDQFGA